MRHTCRVLRVSSLEPCLQLAGLLEPLLLKHKSLNSISPHTLLGFQSRKPKRPVTQLCQGPGSSGSSSEVAQLRCRGQQCATHRRRSWSRCSEVAANPWNDKKLMAREPSKVTWHQSRGKKVKNSPRKTRSGTLLALSFLESLFRCCIKLRKVTQVKCKAAVSFTSKAAATT